jgi:hypothetical protein
LDSIFAGTRNSEIDGMMGVQREKSFIKRKEGLIIAQEASSSKEEASSSGGELLPRF